MSWPRNLGLSAFAAALPALSARGETCVNDICFVDRGGSDEIVLGALRGGISVLDYDRDGFPDLFVGDNAGVTKKLLHNLPDPTRGGDARTFVDATAGSGLDDAENTGRTSLGTLAGDFDNDGWTDLFIVGQLTDPLNFGLLYRNNGDGTFANVSAAAGVRTSDYFVNCASTCDFDLDGDLDLMFAANTSSTRQLHMLINNGDGTFADGAARLPAVSLFIVSYSQLWTDHDADGWPDCVLLTHGGPPILLHNVSDGAGGRRLENVASAVGFTGLGPASMGIAAGDYDRDGDFDLAVSDGVTGTYFSNSGGTFAKFTLPPSIWGWGITWIDADNDGWLDLYTAGSYASSANYDRLFRNLGGGQFADVSSALNARLDATQYAVQLDYNNDGRQDIVALNPGTLTASVFENVSTAPHHWLKIKLAGDGAAVNADAIGAIVRITAGGVSQTAQVLSGSSTTATEDLRVHFGLGAATSVDAIEIIWPRSGDIGSRSDLFAGPFDADQIIALSPRVPCPGDLDGSGVVELGDLGLLLSNYGLSPATPTQGDIDGDADVDLDDLSALLAIYGEVCR